MSKFCARFIGIVLFFTAFFSFAQEAQISYAEGGEFALSSDGRRTSYRADKLNAEGLSLRNEDILQTMAGSFVELRLEPSGTRIKVAENTSLVCKGRGPEGSSLRFVLLYGRIRVSTVGGWSPDTGIPVFIEAGQAEAVFRDGDAGIDYLYTALPSSFGKTEPVMRIYGFSGNVEIIPASGEAPRVPEGTIETKPRLVVPSYESVSIEVMNPFSFVERKPVENEIIQYWNFHNFSGSLRLLDARTAAADSPPLSMPLFESRPTDPPPYMPDSIDNTKIKKVKTGMIVSSIAFIVGGASMQLAGQQRWGGIDSQLGDSLMYYGYLQLGLGAFFGASSLFVNNQIPAPNAAK